MQRNKSVECAISTGSSKERFILSSIDKIGKGGNIKHLTGGRKPFGLTDNQGAFSVTPYAKHA
jgi:hypothetical protein